VSVTQTITNTRLPGGPQSFVFANSQQAWATAQVIIDRKVNGGLNSLTTDDTLDISIDYSTDGGGVWRNVGGATLLGGLIVVKGVTLAQDELTIGIGTLFPTGTGFRLNTNASTAVRIAGTVVYS
jgi:hypothetical protein